MQHLLSDERVILKTNDLVKKIALYRNRLAIQISKGILLYEAKTERDSQGTPRVTYWYALLCYYGFIILFLLS